MNKKLPYISSLLLAAAVSQMSMCAFANTEKLNTLITKALANSTELQVQTLKQESTDSKSTASKFAFLPSFTGEAKWQRNSKETISVQGVPPNTKSVTTTPLFVREFSVIGTLPLFDLTKWQTASLESANSRVEENQKSVVAFSTQKRVASAYFSLLSSLSQIKSVQASLATAKKNLDVVVSKEKSGLLSQLDVLRAQSEVANREQVLSEAEFSKDASFRSLQTLTGSKENLETYLSDTIPEKKSESASETIPESRKEELALQAMQNHPNVALAKSESESASAVSNQIQSAYVPKVSLNAQKKWSTHGGPTGEKYPASAWISALWHLDFSAYSTSESAHFSAAAAKSQEVLQRENILLDMKNLIDEKSLAEKVYASASSQLKYAQLTSDLAQKRFQAGIASLLDVQTAERDLLSAKLSKVQSLVKWNLADFEWGLLQTKGTK